MRNGFTAEHWTDAAGKPAGGITQGTGFVISWQNGPLGACTCGVSAVSVHGAGCARKAPNGAFVEDVISAASERIHAYQLGEFACDENEAALRYLNLALEALESRTRSREARGVEGTHAL